ncbi:extensin-like [Aphis craccivora]|uniref:Extensin-like n=1 Tax=Aphis craccivora TaxID=307492 RepID=A0A6G0Z669_APHCR|nr:extensin-like [Aphis craccivora]
MSFFSKSKFYIIKKEMRAYLLVTACAILLNFALAVLPNKRDVLNYIFCVHIVNKLVVWKICTYHCTRIFINNEYYYKHSMIFLPF